MDLVVQSANKGKGGIGDGSESERQKRDIGGELHLVGGSQGSSRAMKMTEVRPGK